MNLDAILRIKAQATGGEQLDALNKKIQGVEAVTKKLTASSGVLTGALGALAPVASIAGIGALIKGQIEAGDRMYDLAQSTGVSVEMLTKFNKLAKVSGTDLDTVSKGIVKLTKAMSSAASYNPLSESIKKDVEKTEEIIREGEKEQVRLVKEGVDARIAETERESDRALDEIAKRYRRIEKLLSRSFEDQDEQASRAAEEMLEDEQKAIERRYEMQEEAIRNDLNLSESYRKALLQELADQKDDELDALRNRYADAAKERRRQVEDEREKRLDALQERRQKEEAVINEQAEAEKKLYKDSADSRIEELKKVADAAVKALKKNDEADGLSEQLEELGLNGKGASKAFSELQINIKESDGTLKSADKVLLEIADRFKNMPDGLRKTTLATQLFGKAGYELIPMLNEGSAAINKMKASFSEEFAKKADDYSDKLTTLSGKVGGLARGLTVLLLPAMTQLTDMVTAAVDAFSRLPEPIQQATGAIVLFSMAFTALKAIGIISLLQGVVAGLVAIGPAIAGWAGAVVPAVAAITAALTGLLSWMGAVLVPAMIGFFSGPVGWITLAVAAIIAGIVLFKEPIWKFLEWVGKGFQNIFNGIVKWIYDKFLKPWEETWKTIAETPGGFMKGLQKLIGNVIKGLQEKFNNLASALSVPFKIAGNAIIGVFNMVGRSVTDTFNGLFAGINETINKANAVADRLKLPKIPTLPQMTFTPFQLMEVKRDAPAKEASQESDDSTPQAEKPKTPELDFSKIPAFAAGGWTNRAILAQIGEGGDPGGEYAIPGAMMPAAMRAWQQGARGPALVAAMRSGGGGPTGGALNLTVQTGPVLQQPDGSQWVRREELQAVAGAVFEAALAANGSSSVRANNGWAR